MCDFFPSANLFITLLNTNKLLFIYAVSSDASSSFNLSLPAKSTKLKVDV